MGADLLAVIKMCGSQSYSRLSIGCAVHALPHGWVALMMCFAMVQKTQKDCVQCASPCVRRSASFLFLNAAWVVERQLDEAL